MRKLDRAGMVITVLIICLLLPSQAVAGKAEKRREALRKEIEKLEKKRSKLKEDARATERKKMPSGRELEEVIARYEKLLKSCQERKSARCADVLFTLGDLYYEQGRVDYIKARENYERRMDEYDRNPVGPEPVNPKPNYSKSVEMYKRLAMDYPSFQKIDEAYYQMGTIFLLTGDMDNSKKAFQLVVTKTPNSPRASGAHFRLADFAYLEHDYSTAMKHLNQVKESDVNIEIVEMVHYRKAEINYNMAEFDKAINLFYTYVEKCDANIYKKREFRGMALEFMAISFSDMGDGAREAIKFFKRIGNKPYEPYVLYTIGMKNRVHGQFDDAIIALETALKEFPYYKDAPVARQMLIECYVVKKEYEKANEERVRLVDGYGPNGKWYQQNSDQKAVIEQSHKEIKKALASIAIYYHALAAKKKDKSLYEKAIKRYNEFFDKFPNDKWKVYEFRYNIAEIYSSLGDCKKAAENYNYVAMEDLSTYPEYKAEIDTLGMDQEEVEKKKKKADKGPVVISQEDAGYNVIFALDQCRKKAIARDGLTEEQAYQLPETKQLLEYAEKFQARFPNSSNAAEVLYLAGNIYYGAKDYNSAIRVFNQISEKYPKSKVQDKALRMLANSYSSSGQFDMAMSMYQQLLSKQAPDSKEYAEIRDLAAGAMYKRAESMKKKGERMAAADAFKAIYTEYPNSKIADRAWFDAGICYEEDKNMMLAAQTFEELPIKFAKSTLREKAYLRAAEDYKKEKDLNKAAQVYQTAANNITKSEFAIPSLASASKCYDTLQQFDMAGKMYELIYARYPKDKQAAQALYNAGLIYETKAKNYSGAIDAYGQLANKFPNSEYAAEAYFSIGLCYEKMGNNGEMANVFSDYARKYTDDRYKQVQALVKAGDAYFNAKKYEDAEKNYLLASSVYEKYGKKYDVDIVSIAKACYQVGEIYYKRFERIKLDARNERAMRDVVKEKTKALEAPAKYYAKAIELGVAEWTVRATYKVGMGFVDMADAVADQRLFGNQTEQIGAKVKVLSSLEKYYKTAQEYFYKNIQWAHEQNIKGEYVHKSIDKFMEMAYRKGDILEEVGRILRDSPIPPGLSPEEEEAYRQLLEEKYLEALDAALPKYEDAIYAAKDLKIANSPWLDKIRDRIRTINPSSEALNEEIKEWKPEKPEATVAEGEAGTSKPAGTVTFRDEAYERNMSRIKNIMSMSIPVEDKIRQLRRIERDAKRSIAVEQGKIRNLKEQLGS